MIFKTLNFVFKSFILNHFNSIVQFKLKSFIRLDEVSGERQLRVDTGLLCFQSLMPGDGICMMVLTMSDLYAEATDLFVAGIAQMKYRMGIFTLHRL